MQNLKCYGSVAIIMATATRQVLGTYFSNPYMNIP